MSDYARLMEENATLKAQLAGKGEAKAGADSSMKAEKDRALADRDRYRAALQDISEGNETKGDMKDIAAKALAGK